jgi:hypothetical protein
MNRDENSFEALDLTDEITIVRPLPVFVSVYSFIFKGLYRGEAVSCDSYQPDCLTLYQVAIKVLQCNGGTLHAIQRVR